MKPVSLFAVLAVLFLTLSAYSQEEINLNFEDNPIENGNLIVSGAGYYDPSFGLADIHFGFIPNDNAYEGATNGLGATVTAEPGEGILLMLPLVETEQEAMVSCAVRSTQPHVSVTLGTLDNGKYKFVTTTTANNGEFFQNQYRKLTTHFLAKPSNGFQPILQIINTHQTEPVTVYLDNFNVQLLDPEHIVQMPEPTNVPYLVFQPSNTPKPEITPTPIPEPAEESTQPKFVPQLTRVLWIAYRKGYYTEFANLFSEYGAANTFHFFHEDDNFRLTPDNIASHDIIIFCNGNCFRPPLHPDEQDAVKKFVANGGSVMMMGESLNILGTETEYANSVGSLFDVHFGERISGYFTDFVPHPITENLEEYRVIGGSALRFGPAAQALAFTPDNTPIIVAHEYQQGRFLATADELAFSTDERWSDFNITQASHKDLARNVIKWLMRGEEVE